MPLLSFLLLTDKSACRFYRGGTVGALSAVGRRRGVPEMSPTSGGMDDARSRRASFAVIGNSRTDKDDLAHRSVSANWSKRPASRG